MFCLRNQDITDAKAFFYLFFMSNSGYLELMGFPCPAVGGSRSLSADEVARDKEIRMLISEELGHSRINITSVYLGSWSKK